VVRLVIASVKHSHIYDMNQSINFMDTFPTQRCVAPPKLGDSDKYARIARPLPKSNAPCWSPNMVSNMQGCNVKKLIHSDKIRLTSWNIGSLTGILID
jgi:hypothetical protein